MPSRAIREEPRRAPAGKFSPLRTLRRPLWGLLVIVLVMAALAVVGRAFRKKSSTRAERAEDEFASATGLSEESALEIKSYPPLTAAEEKELKETIAVVETDLGRFAFELYPELAPQTVQSFVWLAKQQFYDGQLLAGGQALKGIALDGFSEDPRFQFRIRHEFGELEVEEGAVVLARNIDPGYMEGAPEKDEYLDSGSTGIWIALEPKPPWVPKYSTFGRIIHGLDVASELSLTFIKGFPEYASEVLIYRVRLVPRDQLQAVLNSPVEEPGQPPSWAPERTFLPPG